MRNVHYRLLAAEHVVSVPSTGSLWLWLTLRAACSASSRPRNPSKGHRLSVSAQVMALPSAGIPPMGVLSVLLLANLLAGPEIVPHIMC